MPFVVVQLPLVIESLIDLVQLRLVIELSLVDLHHPWIICD